MSEEPFNWIDPTTYKWWLGSHYYQRLRGFDDHVLPQTYPAMLPFLPRSYQEFKAKMNPWLAVWIFKRYVMDQRVVVEPMVGVGGTGV